MYQCSLVPSREEGVRIRVPAPQVIIAIYLVTCAALAMNSSPVIAARVIEPDGQNQRKLIAKPIRLAQGLSDNPIAAFFSLFAKRKPAPAAVIQVPRSTTRQSRRIFNPYIAGGGRNAPKLSNTGAGYGGRRTMCVRLCDGYYWPVRRGGTNNSLMSDQTTCENQCSSKSRLFVLRTSTDRIASMRDLGGRPYGKLKNAFVYRKTYNPSCGCRPKPWSERALLRHKQYAAVGQERQILAIRSIRMSLRSSLKPDTRSVLPRLVVTHANAVAKRSWDPQLPSRNPLVVWLAPSPLALSRTVPVRKRDVAFGRPDPETDENADARSRHGNAPVASAGPKYPYQVSMPDLRVPGLREERAVWMTQYPEVVARNKSMGDQATGSLQVSNPLNLRTRLN